MTQRTASPVHSPHRLDEEARPGAPRPLARPTARTLFGVTDTIPYRWLRNSSSAEVAQHFAAENAHTDAHTARLAGLREVLGAAVDAPPPPIEPTAPVLLDGWWYIDRYEPGVAATLSRVRHREGLCGPAGIPTIEPGRLLEDEQILVEDCLGMIGFALSADHRLVARAEAALGGCRVIVTEAETGRILDSAIRAAGPELVFSADGRSLVYTRLDDLGRRAEVRSHRIGTSTAEDTVLISEPDHWAQLEISRSRDLSTLLIRSISPQASEVWLADLTDPGATLRSVTGRSRGSLPQIEHAGDRLLVIHEVPGSHRTALSEAGLGAVNALAEMTTVLSATQSEHFESVQAFADVVVIQQRSAGLLGLSLIPRRPDGSLDVENRQTVGRSSEVQAVRMESNPAWRPDAIRYRLDTFLTPSTLLEHDPRTGTSRQLVQADAPGFDAQRYVERRFWATAPDGVRVPITLLSLRDLTPDGTAPALVFGHGAFGTSSEPKLHPEFQAIADLGVVIAIAHVRGGGELGPDWHRQGRQQKKPTSFTDLIACIDHLVDSGWVDPGRVGAVGDGAGGLLVAGAANLAPDRFRAILTGMPLVDPLETLLDPEVMLTLEEWAEWGDPAEDEATFRALRGYSPAENVQHAEYPAVFAWTALEGTDTPAACAAIWVAQLRDRTTSDPEDRPILLRATPTLGSAGDPRVEGVAWLMDQLGAATLGE
ncbi:prolyl oligopeptidase family serine peptidase [Brachybacterium sp.]|uniref:prolyl oligopeptidase family serine peptidase n=1 Tax=Brachybacterium sp. TaxID=1891286 RepID=UPI002ED64FD8